MKVEKVNEANKCHMVFLLFNINILSEDKYRLKLLLAIAAADNNKTDNDSNVVTNILETILIAVEKDKGVLIY